MEPTTNEMFGTDAKTAEEQINELAEYIAIEDNELDMLKSDLAIRKMKLDTAKEQLCNLLKESGMESCKLENGLTPKAILKPKYFKAQGVTDDQLHTWLQKVGLRDIIKPSVHFQTLQGAMKEYEAQHGDVPKEVINVSVQHTVTMYGKTKFITERK